MRLMAYILLPLCIALLVSCGQPQEPQEQEGVSVKSDLVQRAEDFVTLLTQGDFTNAVVDFDSTMKTVMPPSELEKAWVSLIGQVGAFQKQVSTREAKEMGFDVVYVTCDFEKSPLNIKVVFNEAEEISGLWFVPVE
jgi:hypothetical protein